MKGFGLLLNMNGSHCSSIIVAFLAMIFDTMRVTLQLKKKEGSVQSNMGSGLEQLGVDPGLHKGRLSQVDQRLMEMGMSTLTRMVELSRTRKSRRWQEMNKNGTLAAL